MSLESCHEQLKCGGAVLQGLCQIVHLLPKGGVGYNVLLDLWFHEGALQRSHELVESAGIVRNSINGGGSTADGGHHSAEFLGASSGERDDGDNGSGHRERIHDGRDSAWESLSKSVWRDDDEMETDTVGMSVASGMSAP